MDGSADRFLELIHQLEDFTHSISPDQAHSEFDEMTLQLFWMRWPELSAWAGSLWRLLSEELAGPAAPHARLHSATPHWADRGPRPRTAKPTECSVENSSAAEPDVNREPGHGPGRSRVCPSGSLWPGGPRRVPRAR